VIAGTEDSATLMKPKEAEVQRAYDTFAALVHRFWARPRSPRPT
jgi:hypothetical protein